MIQSQRHDAMPHFPLVCAAVILLTASTAMSSVKPKKTKKARPPEQAPAKTERKTSRLGVLQPFNSVVGSWRGIGQPRRGSRKGAWQEQTVCRWDFSAEQPSILFESEAGHQFKQLRLTVSTDGQQLLLHQRVNKTSTRTYHGEIPDKWPARMQLITKPDDDGRRYRCTVTQLKYIRLVMLFEQQVSDTGSFRRVAGIGYTRQGHKLAQGSGNQRECLVTGGQGTIPVQYDGKTWYVCCEGCRQAFEDAPDEIIADYLDRRKQDASRSDSSDD